MSGETRSDHEDRSAEVGVGWALLPVRSSPSSPDRNQAHPTFHPILVPMPPHERAEPSRKMIVRTIPQPNSSLGR